MHAYRTGCLGWFPFVVKIGPFVLVLYLVDLD